MIDAHPHLHVRHGPIVRHHNRAVRDRIVRQTRRVGRQISLRQERRRVFVDARRDMEIHAKGVGIEHADEVAPCVQRRHVPQTDRQRTAGRIDQREFVVVRRGRRLLPFNVKIQRRGDAGKKNRQLRRIQWHLNGKIEPLIGQHRNVHPHAGEQTLGLDLDAQPIHSPGAAMRVVAHRQQPGAGRRPAHKVVQAARSVGGPAQQYLPVAAVVIPQLENRVGRAFKTGVIVQHRELVAVTQIAE